MATRTIDSSTSADVRPPWRPEFPSTGSVPPRFPVLLAVGSVGSVDGSSASLLLHESAAVAAVEWSLAWHRTDRKVHRLRLEAPLPPPAHTPARLSEAGGGFLITGGLGGLGGLGDASSLGRDPGKVHTTLSSSSS